MSQHPSLRKSGKSGAHRSVLKRYERLRTLIDQKRWQEGDSVLGLPKVKTVKVKLAKKGKASGGEKAPEGATAAPKS